MEMTHADRDTDNRRKSQENQVLPSHPLADIAGAHGRRRAAGTGGAQAPGGGGDVVSFAARPYGQNTPTY